MDFPHLNGALDALAGDRLPGATVWVDLCDKPAFVYSAGFSDEENGTEVREQTLFSAYSMTKPLTACVTLKACEQGRLDLQAPVSEYLREFRAFTLLLIDARGKRIVPAKNVPRVFDLLTMSAGFGEDMHLLGCAPTREAVSALAGQPLLFESGTRWLYGLCYEVLGAVLEEVYRLKLREIFQREIFEPCGMANSCFLSEISDYSRLAPVYRVKGTSYESAPLDITYAPHPGYDSAGAGLIMCAEDYACFLRALMHGRILSDESLELMKQDRLVGVMRTDFNWPQTRGYGYGLGIRVPLAGGTDTDYGWGGAAGAYCLMDFELDASLCFFTNVLGADEVYLYSLLRDSFYADMRS